MRTWADATTRKLKGGAAFHPSLVVFAQKVLIVALRDPNFVNVRLRSLSSPPSVGSQPDSFEWGSAGMHQSWEAQLCRQGQVGQPWRTVILAILLLDLAYSTLWKWYHGAAAALVRRCGHFVKLC